MSAKQPLRIGISHGAYPLTIAMTWELINAV
jgi:hypothetical protein